MKKLFLLPLLFLTSLSWGQMNSYSTASLSAACTNATSTCGSIANSQALVSAVGFNVASITVHGSYTGVTLNFDVSDDGGVTWYPDTCTRGDTPIQEVSEAVTNNATRQWDCGVSGTSNFRVRANAISTGSVSVGVTLSVSNIEPAPTVSVSGTVPISGTVTTTPPANASTNVTQVAGQTLGAITTYGTSPGAVLVPGVNANVTNTVSTTSAATTPADATSNTNIPGPQSFTMAWNGTTWDRVKETSGKLLVTPDSVALPANQSVNVSQMNGVTTSMGNGTTDTGTQRVSISSDSTGQVKSTNFPTTVDTNSGAAGASTLRTVPATSTPADATSNTSVPGFQNYTMIFNGSTWDRLKGITGQTGLLAVGTVNSGSNPGDATSQMFTQLNNAGNSQLTATGVGYLFNNSTYDRARSGASANLPNLIGSTLTANVTVDPCQSSAVAKSSAVINISSATTTLLVAVSGSTTIYVCGFTMTMVGATESLKFVYGTQVTNPCDTGQTALTGAMADGTASDIAWSFGPGSTIFKTIASQQLCAVTTGTVSIQGVVTFVQQ